MAVKYGLGVKRDLATLIRPWNTDIATCGLVQSLKGTEENFNHYGLQDPISERGGL